MNNLKYSKVFIFFTLLSITIYNHNNAMLLRIGDIIIAFLSIYSLFNYKEYFRKYLVIFIFIIIILLFSQLLNIKDFYPSLVFNGIRYWFLAFLFFVFGGIFVDQINVIKERKFLFNTLFFCIAVTVLIYFFSYLEIDFVRLYLTPYTESSEASVLHGDRIVGSSITIFYLSLLFFRFYNANMILFYFVAIIFIALFFLHLSRQSLVVFLILFYSLLVGSKSKKILFILTILFVLYIPLSELVMYYIKDQLLFERLYELINFYQSASFFVRFNDTVVFFNDWLNSDFFGFLLGKGIGSLSTVQRFSGFTNLYTGEFISNEISHLGYFHNSDFLLSLLIVDGGLILLVITFVVIYKIFSKIYKHSFFYFSVAILFFLANSISSVHSLTNYGNVMFISIIYHYVQKDA